MRTLFYCALLLLTLPTAWAQTLTVNSQGQIIKDGKPYRAIGVNYVDAFWRVIQNPEDTSYQQGFVDLQSEGIPFARIAAIPFWPIKIHQYLSDPETYLKQLDDIVKAAEDNNVGLVMSLFWADFAVPDTVGEPRNQWGNPDSQTIAFMREYTQTLVKRYGNSPAIWIWEFGNEYNLGCNLPNGATHTSPKVPKLGTPDSRDENDALFTEDIQIAFVEFVKAIREIDTQRPITTGNSMPRPHAESMRKTLTWSKLDTRSELQASLKQATPSSIDIVSVHMYPHHRTENRFLKGEHSSYVEMLSLCKATSRRMNKPLFLGEFGTSQKSLDSKKSIAKDLDALLNAIIATETDLAAIWNFDWGMSNNKTQAYHTITRNNERGYMLEKIRNANLRLRH